MPPSELNNTAIKVSIDVTSLCRNECFLSEDFEVDDLECLACAVQVARIAHCAWREGLKQYRASVDALRDNIKISPTDAGDAGYTHTPGRTSTAYRPQRTLTLALRPSASPPPAWDEGSTPPQPPTPSEKNPILDHDYQYRQYGDNDWLPDDDKVSHPAERPGYPPPVSTLEWEKAAIRQMYAPIPSLEYPPALLHDRLTDIRQGRGRFSKPVHALRILSRPRRWDVEG